MSSRAAPSSASSPLLRFVLRNFVVYNPLFLFSATLVLGGALLLNPPAPGNERSVSLLLQLEGVIQLYHFVLLGAAVLLARRGGLERDVRNLLLVLSPFLLDATFTTASLSAAILNNVDSWQAMLGLSALEAAILLPLLWVKLSLAAKVFGKTFSRGEWLTLLAGPALVILYPMLSAFLPLFGLEAEVGFLGGAGVVALVFAFARFGGESEGGGVLLRLAPLALGAAFLHSAANTWAYDTNLLLVVGPALIALGPALPWLAWPSLAPRDRVTPFLLPAAGALTLGLSGALPLGVSAWQIGLWGFAAVQVVMFKRHRSVHFLAGLLAAAHLNWGGASPLDSLAAIGHNPIEPVALMALFGYGLWKKAHPALLAPTLGLACLSAAHVVDLGAFDAVFGLDLLGVGFLVCAHRVHGRDAAGARARFAGTFLLCVPASVLALVARDPAVAETARLVSWSTVAALLLPAVLLRLRGYALPALLIPAQGAVEIAPAIAPASTGAWGAVVLFAGFVVVSLGVVVSLKREQILAWLERGEAEARQVGAPILRGRRRAEPWYARAALVAGLVAAVAVAAAPATRPFARGYPAKSQIAWKK